MLRLHKEESSLRSLCHVASGDMTCKLTTCPVGLLRSVVSVRTFRPLDLDQLGPEPRSRRQKDGSRCYWLSASVRLGHKWTVIET